MILVANGCPDLVDHATAQKWVDAIQRQVAIDFADAWKQSDVLHYVGDGIGTKPSPGDGIIRIVKSSSEPGTLGSHWYQGGFPVGEVGLQTCRDDGVQPSACLGHETLEMVLDKEATRAMQIGAQFWALEASDRVEGSDDAYVLDGVLLENFSLPAAFLDGTSGPWDFRKKLTSNIIAPGGYQLIYDLKLGQWSQTTGLLARRSKKTAGEASRRAARMKRAGADHTKLVVVPV